MTSFYSCPDLILVAYIMKRKEREMEKHEEYLKLIISEARHLKKQLPTTTQGDLWSRAALIESYAEKVLEFHYPRSEGEESKVLRKCKP